jgi:WXG100 family type VII secretion target
MDNVHHEGRSMSQIRITPEELEQGAKSIEGYRDTINGEISQLNTTITNVTDNWEGAAQSAFLSSYQELYNPTLRETFPEILTGIAEQLKAAAKIMRDTDEELRGAMNG